ncbi:MAG: dockerin type I repeat-containing protein, partial [Lachnospiraceae bacterium]|nr:dockerin type I repeat-containing protein [Lachnospiraceae bacterium]
GDVNSDGEFSILDVVLFKKWLLAIPDVKLDNWKTANLYEDDKLDVFDLCLMKRMLIQKIN